MTWESVTRFAQLEPGDTVRFKYRPEVVGTYRGHGHGWAIVWTDHPLLPGAPRDVLCKLKEIEVKHKEAV